jgi:hypothetical protein
MKWMDGWLDGWIDGWIIESIIAVFGKKTLELKKS